MTQTVLLGLGVGMVGSAHNLRIGVVSIRRSIENPAAISFEHLLGAIGMNTGNLMFSEAMFRLLRGSVERIEFLFDPDHINKNFDHVVIPAANWLNRDSDWDWFLERLEKLTVPVTVIGLGLQAETTDLAKVVVSESSMRLARFLGERTTAISVRGNFTRDWMNSIGVRNVVTTGCPSLYMNIFEVSTKPENSNFILQATRYGASKSFSSRQSVDKQIFSAAARLQVPMIYQSEFEEIQRLVYKTEISELGQSVENALIETYAVRSIDEVEQYLDAFGKVFFNLTDWSHCVVGTRGVFGTRLHGSIIALNSGSNAVLHGHDSRTQELIEFAKIPTISDDLIPSLVTKDDFINVIASASVEDYLDVRSKNQETFQAFLRAVGIKPETKNMF